MNTGPRTVRIRYARNDALSGREGGIFDACGFVEAHMLEEGRPR